MRVIVDIFVDQSTGYAMEIRGNCSILTRSGDYILIWLLEALEASVGGVDIYDDSLKTPYIVTTM